MNSQIYNRTTKLLIKVGDAEEGGNVINTGPGTVYSAYTVLKLGRPFSMSVNKVPGANNGHMTVRSDFSAGDQVQYAYR